MQVFGRLNWTTLIGCVLLLGGCATPSRESSYCYTFSSIHESCTVAVSSLVGCESGTNKEYAWHASCVGWFDVYHPGPKRVCFKERRQPKGSCTEGALGSLPVDHRTR